MAFDPFSALATLGSGALSFLGASRQNKTAQEAAARNIALQQDFAKHGIQWKVEDAKAAGIHPLYALGAQTHSFSPVSVGAVNELAGPASAMAQMGQDVSRAMQATRTADQRVEAFNQTVRDLTVQKLGLENQVLASKVAQMRGVGPPMQAATVAPPIPESNKFDPLKQLWFAGDKVWQDPFTSNMQEYEQRYGDEGIASWIIPPFIMYQDMLRNAGVETRASMPARMFKYMVNMPSSPPVGELWERYKSSWK